MENRTYSTVDGRTVSSRAVWHTDPPEPRSQYICRRTSAPELSHWIFTGHASELKLADGEVQPCASNSTVQEVAVLSAATVPLDAPCVDSTRDCPAKAGSESRIASRSLMLERRHAGECHVSRTASRVHLDLDVVSARPIDTSWGNRPRHTVVVGPVESGVVSV